MGLGNFLRGIAAQVLPSFIDHGQTYGTFNQKKKPQPGDPGYVAPTPQNSNVAPLEVQQPQNHFDTGITHLNNPLSLQNSVTPAGVHPNLAPLMKPQPGTVIKPSQPAQPGAPVQAKPGYTPPTTPGSRGMQDGYAGTYTKNGFVRDAQPKKTGFWGHVGNGLKIAGETAVGTVANVPEVLLAGGRAGSGIVQGVTQLPHAVTAITATGTEKLNNAVDNRFTHALNTGVQKANTGVKTATNFVDKPIDALNRGLDRAAAGYERAVPMASGGAKVYKTEQIPLNILAGLVTLGGSTAAEAGGQAGRAEEAGNIFTRFLNKPLSSNPENVVARGGQAITNRTAPVVQTLNAPFTSGKNAITRFIGNNRVLNPAERELIDAGEAGNIAADAGNAGQTTQIPVTQEGGNVPIPVRTPQPGAIIRENSGDARFPGTVPTPEEAAAARARNAFDSQAPGRPDQSVSGVVSVPRTEPFRVDTNAAASAQNDVVDQYAQFLKDMGEGNGTQLVPDGEGGYTRTTNNFRSEGKRMTKQDWRDRAEADLKAGRAEPGHQKAFDDANNPDVQSLLAKGDQTEEPQLGSPIQVKQVTGIPVEDRSVVPQGLPETPGQVRVTQATDPNAVRTQAAAATMPVVNTPPSLPAEVQRILDNPKQFNKRQVAAARNQRKMANQVAKANEDTAAALERIDTASPAAQSGEGFTPTGEFARSQNGGKLPKSQPRR
jgi:hypothetical protein